MDEVNFTFEQVREGIKEFLLKYSAPTSLSPIAKPLKYFHTVISLNEGTESERVFRELMNKSVDPWFGSFEIVSNTSNKHIEAMAASDFGLAYDG